MNDAFYENSAGKRGKAIEVTFNLSTLSLNHQEKSDYRNVAKQTDIYQILKTNSVSPHFKTAKIICNQLGWKLEFNTMQDTKCKLFIPLKDDSEVDSNPEVDEETKEGFNDFNQPRRESLRPTVYSGRPGSGFNATPGSLRSQNKNMQNERALFSAPSKVGG